MSGGASGGADTQDVSTGGTGQPEDARIRPDVAALYSKHRQLMSNTAFRVLGPTRRDHVQDVVQDAWAKVQQHYKRPAENDPDNWAAWLATVTRNCAYDRLAKEKPYDDYAELDSLAGEDRATEADDRPTVRPRRAADPDPVGDEVIERDRVQRLRALIAQLPQDEATIVHTKLLEDGYSNAEIGRMLATPRTGQSVGQVLRRVLADFAQELKGGPQ